MTLSALFNLRFSGYFGRNRITRTGAHHFGSFGIVEKHWSKTRIWIKDCDKNWDTNWDNRLGSRMGMKDLDRWSRSKIGIRTGINYMNQGYRIGIGNRVHGLGSRFGSRIGFKDRHQESGSSIGINNQDQRWGSRFKVKDQDQGLGSRIKDNLILSFLS